MLNLLPLPTPLTLLTVYVSYTVAYMPMYIAVLLEHYDGNIAFLLYGLWSKKKGGGLMGDTLWTVSTALARAVLKVHL